MSHPLQVELINEVIKREGGYVNHPHDRGGPTRYGITERVARAHGYRGSMTELPTGVAFDIYSARYWHSLRLDTIVELHEGLATALFDYGVHSGPAASAEDFQRILNVLNRQERDYNDLSVDGAIGPATLAALEGYVDARGRPGLDVLFHAQNAVRLTFLIELAERRPTQESFSYGWLARVIALGEAK